MVNDLRETDDLVERALFGTSVFKKDGETKLFPEFVPDTLPRRENEIIMIGRDFKPLLIKEGAYAVNVAVIGGPGTGKTAMVKYLGERLVKKAKQKNDVTIYFAYYNCYTFRTKTAILRNLLTERFNITSRGFSDEELLSMLIKRLNSEQARLLLVIDEACIIGGDAILSLIHAAEVYGFGRSSISTIIISRPTEWKTMLDAQLSGHIQDQIDMKGYTKEELLEIIDYRAKLAFKPEVISSEVIDMIAEVASKTENARHGIEMLHLSGKLADYMAEKTITPEMIRKVKGDVYPELRPDVFYNLKTHELLTAMGIAKRLKRRNITATTIDEAHEYYKIACEEFNTRKHTKPTFRKHVSVLSDLGIIGMIVGPIGRGRRGRRGRITLYDIPAHVLEERSRNIIEERIKRSLA